MNKFCNSLDYSHFNFGNQIDKEDIISNEQIESILSRPTKDAGVAAFIKYHYELLGLLRERFNFTVNFRNSRGWAGRLGNTTFRLGLLGIVMRNEADIAASGAFNRINRFAEFDTIHQSWKFETAFLYRYTSIWILMERVVTFCRHSATEFGCSVY